MGKFRCQSFYDWCVENNRKDLLDLWDYEKNDKKPSEISSSNVHNFYFKCEQGKHDSFLRQIHSITRKNAQIKCPTCCSFGEWCKDNNRLDLLNRWDYSLNDVSPFEISMSSKKKQYFKCPKDIHDSELKDLNNIRRQYGTSLCSQCYSIGQWGIDKVDKDFIEKYWSEKNKFSPMKIAKFSQQNAYFKCNRKSYHEDYICSCSNFVKGERCPYCAGKKVDKKNDSLAVKFPFSKTVWSKKNKSEPYEYLPYSNKTVWWKCENGIHSDFRRTIYASNNAGFCCPICSKKNNESKLQKKVREYVESIFNDVRHEYACNIIAINPLTNYKLPYDNEINDIKLIIEVNGEQHYKNNSFFYSKDNYYSNSFEHRKYLDNLKKQYALNNGYDFLEIPYWTDDKNETWKNLIDEKIKSIANN